MNRTVILAGRCGGTGESFGRMTTDCVGPWPGLKSLSIDTKTPAGVARADSIELSPQNLPAEPTETVDGARRMTPIKNWEVYRQLCELVSAQGLAQAPCMSWIVGIDKLLDIKEKIERDVRTLAKAVGGANRLIFLTIASALGGTGTPAARVAGCALRLAAQGTYLPADSRWVHVLVSSAVLGDGCRTRRTIALERRQLEEFEALMQPGATLRLPGCMDPISPPGPDEIIIISSSAEAPRTLEECAEELAAVLRHWLKAEVGE